MISTMTDNFMLAASFLPIAQSMGSVYVICLIVGCGLLAISTVFAGQHDAGVDGDVGTDFGADGQADFGTDGHFDHAGHGHVGSVLSLSSWFSIHFLVYFAAMFGLVGTVLTYVQGGRSGAILVASVVGGLIAGQGVHQLLRYLRRSSSNSLTSSGEYLNQVARVTVAIAPSTKGEIAVRVRGRERFVVATGKRAEDEFHVGDEVGIVGFGAGRAEVVSRKEFEFITQSQ